MFLQISIHTVQRTRFIAADNGNNRIIIYAYRLQHIALCIFINGNIILR